MIGGDSGIHGCCEIDVCVETEASMNTGDPGTERQVCSDSAELTDKTCFKHLSFLHWNVNGLLTKLKDRELIQYISSFHFVCLVETFVDYLEPSVFSSHTVFCKPAVKFTKQGRKSGGVLCLIKNELVPYVREIKCDRGHFLCFLLDKRLFGFNRDVVYMCAYVPPENSPYYTAFDVDDGISLLEESLADEMLSLDDVYILLCGDLNSRTANEFPISQSGNDVFTRPVEETPTRCSEDTVLNSFGKKLLNMCTTFGVNILNGVCNGDLQGRYTFISNSGNSVNDYFMVSEDLFSLIQHDCRLCVIERIESDHMPLELHTNVEEMIGHRAEVDKNECTDKFVWKADYAQQFIESMHSDITKEQLSLALSLIDVDINEALKSFNDCLKQNAECMKRKIYVNRPKKMDEWYDEECRAARKNVRKLLRKFRKSLDRLVCKDYCCARREYKKLLQQKKKKFNENVLNKLMQSVSDQQAFWQNMRKISKTKYQPYNSISEQDWFNHFQKVLEQDNQDQDSDDDFENCVSDVYYDRPITREEVLLAIQRLKNGKASGPDSIIGEFFKHAGHLAVDFLVKFFNVLFERGIYPDSWTESIIIPLFKNGNQNDPDNYRGISLCDISSKLYSSIINNRLQEWIEQNSLTGECQAGFKKDYSTVDHMFTLIAMIQKQFALNRKLYVAFIDFEKAFDSISRKLLWPILLKNGIKGRLYKCVRSMYENVKARIRCGAKFTDYIKCTRGVKQGDVCSPVLFSLFINDLALDIINNGRHGVSLSSDFVQLVILLFADDMILISETVIGLQTQLNSLFSAASRLQLKVNMNKSNIVVFRKGGYLGARERWIYDGCMMRVVNSYKYLGICFSTRLSFYHACQDLVSRAKRALLCTMSDIELTAILLMFFF